MIIPSIRSHPGTSEPADNDLRWEVETPDSEQDQPVKLTTERFRLIPPKDVVEDTRTSYFDKALQGSIQCKLHRTHILNILKYSQYVIMQMRFSRSSMESILRTSSNKALRCGVCQSFFIYILKGNGLCRLHRASHLER